MIAALLKGWCPGALRPMAARDGLLVRLRITGGVLPAATAHAIADLAADHGNGLFDLSARGNLQLRGVRDDRLAALQEGLGALGLLDRDAASESVRNVLASPLAGLLGGIDIRPSVDALETRLVEDTSLHGLPGRFGFLIDDGGAPSLAGVSADIRFDWIADRFSIGLGGSRGTAVRIGTCRADDLVASAVAVASGALALLARAPDARRMRDLLAAFGAEAVAHACGRANAPRLSDGVSIAARDVVGCQRFATSLEETGASAVPACDAARPPPPATVLLPRFAEEDVACLGLAAPFGRLDAAMLQAAADIAAATPLGEIRLTPWRTLLIPGATRGTSPTGYIIDPSDPRLAIAACVGAGGCARGTTATHRDATRLAHAIAPNAAGIVLHVSGCEKGCAKPSSSPVTLVARDGRYDLVRDGRAGDPPVRRGLDLAATIDALQTTLEPT